MRRHESGTTERKERVGQSPALSSVPHPALIALVRLLARSAARGELGGVQADQSDTHMTKADPVGELRLLSLADTCAVLGCSMKTLRRRIAEGAIAVIRDGRLIRIHPDDLRRYIQQRRHG